LSSPGTRISLLEPVDRSRRFRPLVALVLRTLTSPWHLADTDLQLTRTTRPLRRVRYAARFASRTEVHGARLSCGSDNQEFCVSVDLATTPAQDQRPEGRQPCLGRAGLIVSASLVSRFRDPTSAHPTERPPMSVKSTGLIL
jgi:hypothetical protein